ncbi:MAG: thioredoxin family protein [Vicinamibacteria bacterium]|nr:thioredoxin family protein [Vicinamibacteria bacterium]
MSGAALVVSLVLFGAAGAQEAGGRVSIRWHSGFDEAQRKARQTKKPLLVDFWAEWCSWCHRLDQTTYIDPTVVRISEAFVAVKVDTEGSSREKAVADRYRVVSLPTVLFLTPQGRLIRRVDGFQGPGQFPRTLLETQELAQKVMGWEQALDKDKNDVDALVGLGVHLHDLEFFAEAKELLQRARGRDQGRELDERKRVRMMLGIIQHYDRRFEDAESLLREGLDLGPSRDYDPKILYVMGKNYSKWGKLDDARAALETCIRISGGGPLASKAREMIFWLEREEKQRHKRERERP